MRIRIKNEFGVFEVGGGSHPTARLLEIAGIGLPEKEDTTVTFEGQPGQTLTNTRVQARTITMSFDFYGNERTVTKLYRILYCPVELEFFLGDVRRRIGARCSASTDIKKIIYRKWQSITIQFKCDDPFFYDLYDEKKAISKSQDMLPNDNSDGSWKISLPVIATQRFNEAVIYNGGDVKVYPLIILEQNMTTSTAAVSESSIILTNRTTNKTITINRSISGNEIIEIDLSKRKITSSIDGDITNYISDDTALSDFYLDIGNNDISLTAEGDAFAEAVFSNKYISVVI